MKRDTKYLKDHTDKQLIRARDDAQRVITGGKMIGRVDPYLEIIKDINHELARRLDV